MSPLPKYWGDMSPLSHRDRCPCPQNRKYTYCNAAKGVPRASNAPDITCTENLVKFGRDVSEIQLYVHGWTDKQSDCMTPLITAPTRPWYIMIANFYDDVMYAVVNPGIGR